MIATSSEPQGTDRPSASRRPGGAGATTLTESLGVLGLETLALDRFTSATVTSRHQIPGRLADQRAQVAVVDADPQLVGVRGPGENGVNVDPWLQ